MGQVMEKKKDRKKIITVLSLVISIILIIALATYAWFTWNSPDNTELTMTVGNLAEIKFETGNDISEDNMGPILDYNKDGEITTFSIKNKADYSYYIDIILNIDSIDQELKNETFKYKILESDNNTTFTELKTGDFSTINTGSNTIYSLELSASSTKYYKFIMYIDGSVENNTNMMGKSIKGYLTANASNTKPLVSEVMDDSGANVPKIAEGLIPVVYDETQSSWVRANITDKNGEYKWYDYDNKQWANAVLVSSTNRSNYLSSEIGTVINEEDILAYYVWIPRYKYKVWNINKVIGTDSYNAQTTGIDITFEQGTTSTGDINCNNYSFASVSSSTRSETCSGTNGQYYTHPAFTFGDIELTGIWVGKFEISAPTDSSCYTNQSYANCETADLEPRTKPNVKSWRYNFVDSFEGAIQNMQSSGNEYGLSTDTSKVDSHMLKNMEWGAVAYLTHSDYGRCNGSSCEEVTINSNSSYTTGGGNYVSNVAQSSTGNIYGIYDLSGGAYEYVMGNMSSGSGSYTYNAKSAGSNFSYSASTAKYIDTYAYGTSYGDQTAYNRARLGDATGEVVSSSYTAWNNDYANFVYSSYPWFLRGGVSNAGSLAGVFFYRDNGVSYGDHSARAALLAL